MKPGNVHGVHCLFVYDDTSEGWRLRRVKVEDKDGRVDGLRAADAIDGLLRPADGDPDGPGRLVASWTFRSGVFLYGVVPPVESRWLNAHLLRHLPDWDRYVAGGYDVVVATAAEAARVLAGGGRS